MLGPRHLISDLHSVASTNFPGVAARDVYLQIQEHVFLELCSCTTVAVQHDVV